MSGVPRCKVQVHIREQLRYTGRGRYGFERHYTKDQCSRPAKQDGKCWQHLNDGIDHFMLDWHEFVDDKDTN